MTSKPLPYNFTLDPDFGPEVLSDKYEHWTVQDLLEILESYHKDARVWITPARWGSPVSVRPLENVMGVKGDVFL